MSTQIQVIGQVVSGRGMGRQHVLHYQEKLRAIARQSVYPGTLNILLNLPLRLQDNAGYQCDDEGGMMWPAFLFGVEVWLCRCPSFPLHVVEILSSVCLRKRFNLKDGEDVILTLSGEKKGAINPLGRIAWLALWMGRRKSFYLRDTCYTGQNRTMIWSKKLGAQQQPPEVMGAAQLTRFVARKIGKELGAVGTRITERIKTNAHRCKTPVPATASLFESVGNPSSQSPSKT
jgi:hypothetical protein